MRWFLVLALCGSVWGSEQSEKEYQAAVEKAKAEYDAKVKVAKDKFVKSLIQERDAEMVGKQLAKANVIQAKIDALIASELKTIPEDKKEPDVEISKAATYKVSSQWRGLKPLPGLLDGVGGGYTGDGAKGSEYAFSTNFEKNPYIIIDLKRVYTISKIIITNRPSWQERATGLVVSAGDTENGPWTDVWEAEKAQPQWEIAEKIPKTQFFKIWLKGQNFLHLNSVAIFGK